jgi:hypothetical protein
MHTEITKKRLLVAEAGIISGNGHYVFPYEHLLYCQAYLAQPDAFEKTWIQLCLKLYRYAHTVYGVWFNDPFVLKHDELREIFEQTSVLYKPGIDLYYPDFDSIVTKNLPSMTLAELRKELDCFLNIWKVIIHSVHRQDSLWVRKMLPLVPKNIIISILA